MCLPVRIYLAVKFFQNFNVGVCQLFASSGDEIAVILFVTTVVEAELRGDIALVAVAIGNNKGHFEGGVFLDEHAVGVEHFVRSCDKGNITDCDHVQRQVFVITGFGTIVHAVDRENTVD